MPIHQALENPCIRCLSALESAVDELLTRVDAQLLRETIQLLTAQKLRGLAWF